MSIELTEELQEVAAHTRVLSDRLLVKPLPYIHPVLATPGVNVHKGVIIAAGPGRRQRRLVEFRHDAPPAPVIGPTGKVATFAKTRTTGRTLYFEDGPETGRLLPMQLKPGDVIEFSYRNAQIIDFDRIPRFFNLRVGELAFVWYKSVYFVDNEPDLNKLCAEALLFQQSAGYDRRGNWMSGAENWAQA